MTKMKRHEIDEQTRITAQEILLLATDEKVISRLNEMLNPGMLITFVHDKDMAVISVKINDVKESSISLINEGGSIYFESAEENTRAALIVRKLKSCMNAAMKDR